MNLHPLAAFSLFPTYCMACHSTCYCEDAIGTYTCYKAIESWNFLKQYNCEGYCRDRTCAGRDAEGRGCRLWKGSCHHDSDGLSGGGIPLPECGREGLGGDNNCPDAYDCPAPKPPKHLFGRESSGPLLEAV